MYKWFEKKDCLGRRQGRIVCTTLYPDLLLAQLHGAFVWLFHHTFTDADFLHYQYAGNYYFAQNGHNQYVTFLAAGGQRGIVGHELVDGHVLDLNFVVLEQHIHFLLVLLHRFADADSPGFHYVAANNSLFLHYGQHHRPMGF